jgi:hypothetical protein
LLNHRYLSHKVTLAMFLRIAAVFVDFTMTGVPLGVQFAPERVATLCSGASIALNSVMAISFVYNLLTGVEDPSEKMQRGVRAV